MANYDIFNPALILRQATPDIVARGRSYFYSGQTTVASTARFRAVVSVRGSQPQPYTVTIRWSESGAEADCTCAYSSGQPRLICKHKVAAALATEHFLRLHPHVSWQSILDEALGANVAASGAGTGKAAAKPSKQVLVFSLQQRYNNWGVYVYGVNANYFDLEMLSQPGYIAETVQQDQLSARAKHSRTPLDRSRIVNDTDAVMIAADLCWAYQQATPYNWSAPNTVHRLIPFLRDCPLFTGLEDSPLKQALHVASEPAHLKVELRRVIDAETESDEAAIQASPVGIVPMATLPGGEVLNLQTEAVKIISVNPAWLLHKSDLVEVSGPLHLIEPLMRSTDLMIPDAEMPEFTTRYLAPLAARLPVTGEGLHWSDLEATPVARLYLKQSDHGEPVAELRFAYGEQGIVLGPNPARTETEVVHVAKDQTFARVHRDTAAEEAAEQALAANGLRRDPRTGEYALRANTTVLAFLMHQIPQLMEAGFEVFGEENLTNAKINRSTPRLTMHVSSGIDWFDVQMGVAFGENATASLKTLRQAVKKRERYVKLSDGSIGALPEEWIKKYSYLFALASETEGANGEEELRLQKHHAILLGDLLEDADSTGEADASFFDTLHRLRTFETIQRHPLPATLDGTLRAYQKHGFDWLHFLREYGAGGCIADDMGLGKTVQVLAFLDSLRQRIADSDDSRRASLVVVPRSLIFNWQREAARFTPEIKLLVHADQNRDKSGESFDDYDIVLTTYGILVRDIEILKDHKFACAILDESQSIKNPAALSAKASRLLNAEQRITLTGTPVENSTQDLWSQFAFLNPGLLGSLEQFRTQFGAAIDRTQDETKANQLRRLVHPFLLRRTKEQVAPELPPRTERIVYTEMEPDQRKLYDETKQHYAGMLMGMIERDGLAKSRMKVLEGLLRLRQISNHPKLVNHDWEGSSAKFDGLMQTLHELQAEGHKALVFSQFVQMLRLVETEMNAQGLRYEMLTGQTRDRQARVDSFQNDPTIPFFLISLKAGGVGLNLTAADYVIHIDPWWNPAVEMQATDRTHRIGQDKPVFIYKMIAQNSVEDKILQLQERKRNVVEQVIASDGGFFKSLTQDDIAGLFG